MKIIYVSQLYNLNGNNLYIDIAFLTVHSSREKDALNKAYYVIDSLDDRYFIGPKSDILRSFEKGLKINNWQEQPTKDRPFNCVLNNKDKFLYKKDIISLLFEIKH